MKKLIAMLLAAAMVLCFVGCSPKTSEPASDSNLTPEQAKELVDSLNAEADKIANSDLAYVQDKGTLIVGITDFAPMDYKDANGEWIGFDADMAKAFAASLGVAVEFIEIDWDNKIFELNGKTIDCVWNGMTLTDEVLNAMSCSKPYCDNAQVVVVKSDAAAN